MAHPAKTSSRSAAGRNAGRVTPKRQGPPELPFLRFYHPTALRTKTLAVLDELEDSQDPTQHREALAGIAVDLVRCGMDAYFMKPLELAKAGFIVERSANLGIASAVQVMSSVIRNMIGRMNAPQLRSVSGSIRQFMR